MKLRYAMVCSLNQNRSLEAHSLLKMQGFDVSSYYTGTHIKIPGPSIWEPNIYELGTPYKQMFDALHRKDPNLYPYWIACVLIRLRVCVWGVIWIGNFLSISRSWNSGDKITLELPLGLRTECLVDDRPDYGSLCAILYGPYVLAGWSLGDHEIATGLVLSKSMSSSSPSFEEFSSLGDVIGKLVMLEHFDFPGMLVSHSGVDKGLFIGKRDSTTEFHVVKGLGGEDVTFSLESKTEKGCFVYNGQEVTLSCGSGSSKNAGFAKGASFVLEKGLREYHPISFVVKGKMRSYVLEPIMNMRDEFYNVYFHILN
ncbi:hypothetical protein Droror1_Dr00024249 [Drosera rotundifolia]